MSNKTLTILVGPPGSGKTTYAKEMVDQNFVRVSQDDQGKGGHLEVFGRALADSQNIVVDRMNFSKGQRQRYIEPAKKEGYKIEIVVFFAPRLYCLGGCLDRTDHPTIKSEDDAKKAINWFFRKFEYPTEDEGEVRHVRKGATWKTPEYVICDLDGTLCDIDHRLHFVRREGKKDWKSFFEGIPGDVPNEWCMRLIELLNRDYRIIFVSGRGEEWREQTKTWLDKHVPLDIMIDSELHMRPAGDSRPDTLIKQIIYDFDIFPKYGQKPLFAIDDRPAVCRMWRSLGITVLQCNDVEF